MVYALRFLSSPNAEHSSGPGTFLRRPSEDGPRPEHSPGLWTLLQVLTLLGLWTFLQALTSPGPFTFPQAVQAPSGQ